MIDYLDYRIVLRGMWRNVWKGIADYESYYLPAARSGILQLWDLVQLYTLENLPEEFGFTDLVRDFLGDVAKTAVRGFGGGGKRRLVEALEVLEREIMRGEVVLVRERPGPSRLEYRFGDGASLSIQRASSMVAELAPLDLLIKRILGKGDLLIIEEPEAHLHPSSQIEIAKVLARLVNSGFRVICTTHSPLLVNRISNLMLAGKVRKRVREDIGLKAADIIKGEDLAVYQFVAGDGGSIVNRLKMVSKYGIPEDEFLREYEKISLESYKVSS
jgi:predicted ATPase